MNNQLESFAKSFIGTQKIIQKRDSDLCTKKCKAKCCKHINIVIAIPTTDEEIDALYFYLLHNGIELGINFENQLVLTLKTICEKLDIVSNKCTIHETKPMICASYPLDGTYCEFYGDTFKKRFKTKQELIDYFKKYKEE
jgi:Fe-S-cluster containining protein